jgi:hypothetical protein
MLLPNHAKRHSIAAAALLVSIGAHFAASAAQPLPPLPGAIFTAAAPAAPGGPCTTVNSNLYALKGDVYVNGGPDHPGAAGLLPNTAYYVQVTDPSGAVLLGTSLQNANSQKPVRTNALGNFEKCYRLIEIVSFAGQYGYDNTPNLGGVYKLWVSTDPNFANNSTKTDNFKVDNGNPPVDSINRITIAKFYDANANGTQDPGELDITGWKVDLLGRAPKSTFAEYTLLDDGTYVAEEYTPIQTNWYATSVTVNGVLQTNSSTTPVILNAAGVTVLAPNATEGAVKFGNVCTGPGGGLTLGFWSNKNGQAAMDAMAGGMSQALIFLSGLNLKDAKGNDFNPANYASFRTWLLNGNAVNMAYMLSVQLAAMELNVRGLKVNGNALIYAPGTNSANSVGFASVSDVMAEANASLANDALTLAGVPPRAYQEWLKNALDNANNNRTFVQATACVFTFLNPVTP